MTNFIQDDEILEGVTTIRARQDEDGEWVFVVLQGYKPHMIFPRMYSQGSLKNHANNEVLVSVDTKPDSTIINVQFDNFSNANAFYRLLFSTP